MIPPPPYWADRLLEWYCNPELVEDLQGDLYEIYENYYTLHGPARARLYYWWLILRSFRYSAIKKSQTQNPVNMTTNHLKIAWRLMLRNKLNASLNILGLVLGIACFILLGMFVKREITFDRFHDRHGDIYRVWLLENYGEGQEFFNTTTPPVFHDFLKNNFSQFDQVVQYDARNWKVESGELRFNERIAILSPEFFNVFDFPYTESTSDNPLSSPSSIILTESYAIKYFGNEAPLGKTLLVQVNGENRPFEVTGILKDLPANTGFNLDMAISSLNNRDIYGEDRLNAWFTVSPETYVLLRAGESITDAESSAQSTVMKVLGDRVAEGEYNIGFQPIADIHLNKEFPAGILPVGNKAEVYILGAIAILVLTIACLNFITMSLAQCANRFKEVGIRKVMGAFRQSLVRQHLTESMLTVSISAVAAILLAWLAVPFFNSLTDAGIVLTFAWWHVPAAILLIIFLGILSGFYPGLVLARWRTTEVFRGKARTGRNHLFRRGIVIFQFMITAFLISCTLIMNRQLAFVQNSDLGIEYKATISAILPPDPQAGNLVELINGTMERSRVILDKLENTPGITDVAVGSHAFGTDGWTSIGFRDTKNNFREVNLLVATPDYFNTFSIEMAQGRRFQLNNPADRSGGVILNETAASYFGLEDPVGSQLPNTGFGTHEIIGVAKDFNFSSLHETIQPLIIVQDPSFIAPGISDIMYNDFPSPKVVFRYSGNPISGVRDVLEYAWQEVYPDEELSFDIIEENMQYQYAREKRMQRLMLSATVLSVLIACMGLLGLTILTVNGKVKEIGIRKVVGASSADIFRSLAGGIVFLLSAGIVLSVPVVYWLMNDWLDEFAYHIDISIWQFIISAVIALVISLLVISYHTMKAARHNPVTSLRTE